MKLSGMAWKATLQASQSSSFILWLGPPSFLFHSSPDILNNIHIWKLCWPSLDLLPPEKLHSGTWGMARSFIVLKNLTPLVVGNVLGGNNLLIFVTINVTIHLTDLPGTSLLDVTPNHNLPTSKFDYLLGQPWVQTGPWGSSTILAALGMELNWRFIWKIYFLPLFCCPRLWALAYATRFLSCLLFSAGQQYDRGGHCEQESDVQFLTKQASLVSTPPGAVRRLWAWLFTVGPASFHLEQLSCAVCPTWVYHGHRQSLGSTCESSPPAI